MLPFHRGLVLVLATSVFGCVPAIAGETCQGFGPQTPRDITKKDGENLRVFSLAPAYTQMNLCDIHFHKNAEHKGPGFSDFAGDGKFGGYRCNGSDEPTGASSLEPAESHCEHLEVGDTIEVHWVYTSCGEKPGPGLGTCLADETECRNPALRVETQVFLVVDDPAAPDFFAYDYSGEIVNGYYQADALPTGTGEPVSFLGSTTGPDFSDEVCSPLQVSWSVRPQCAKISFESLNKWCEDNDFDENEAHGVRTLVTNPKLLSKIP